MQRADQLERTGDPSLPAGTKLPPSQDHVRAVRLGAIIDEHGWPTHNLVGEQAASAAWLVAQHADFDVASQRRLWACSRRPRTPARPTSPRPPISRTASP